MLRRRLLLKKVDSINLISYDDIKSGNYDVSDGILVLDAVSDHTKYLCLASDWDSSYLDEYTPIGVLVIPHFHMDNRKMRAVSLVEMSNTSPDTGASSHTSLYWGGGLTDTADLNDYPGGNYIGTGSSLNSNVQGTNSGITYLPSDNFSTVQNTYDTNTYYYYSDSAYYQSPSPFLTNGSFNSAYSQTTSPASTDNALSDFDGEGNTEILTSLATSQSSWKTASSITNSTNSGYYAGACCCWRFHTNGTSQGDWILPSIGELGYIMPNFKVINSAINTVSGLQIANGEYMSSTEGNASYDRSLVTTYGQLNYYTKNFGKYVRAFLPLTVYEFSAEHKNIVKNISESEVGDICLYDIDSKQKIYVSYSSYSTSLFPINEYEVLGIVVIPVSHDVYGTGEGAIMSVVGMDCSTPDTGNTSSNATIYWGGYGTNLSLTDYDEVINNGYGGMFFETDSYEGETNAYLPSDQFTVVQCPSDTDTYYYSGSTDVYYCPPPYLTDDSRNPLYYTTQVSSGQTIANALSDYDGEGNTTVMINTATYQSDWQTASSITNVYNIGCYPAACCCWRYHTNHTNQGDWYMPAMGEMGYIMSRISTINLSLTAVNGVVLNTNYYYWSSTEVNANQCRRLDTGTGRVFAYNKSTPNYVRAFMKIS